MTAVDDAFTALNTQLNYINGLVNEIAAGTNVQGNVTTLQGVMADAMTAASNAAAAAAAVTNQAAADCTAQLNNQDRQNVATQSTLQQQIAALQAQLAAAVAAGTPIPQLPPAPLPTPGSVTPAAPATSTTPTAPGTSTTPQQGFTTGATAAIGVGAALVGFVAGRMTKK